MAKLGNLARSRGKFGCQWVDNTYKLELTNTVAMLTLMGNVTNIFALFS